MRHIAAARAALLLIWPDGEKCQHQHARTAFHALDAAEKREKELADALESMCHQFMSVRDGKLHHDFMSAGEAAFEALGWDDDGHQLDQTCLCEVPGCGAGWSCGSNGKDGKYHTFCSPHFSAWIDAGNHETPEQGEARWEKDMRAAGISDLEIEGVRAANKARAQAWETREAKK